MDHKRTMTLNLTVSEMAALEDLAARKDMSKTAILRHALRLYQLIDAKITKGGRLYLEDDKKAKAELLVV